MKRRDSTIDGLRAIAVLLVVLCHTGSSLFKGGYIGVDIFFVISGFLITGILRNEVSDWKVALSRFYERRARRIVPMLIVVVAMSFGLAVFFCGIEQENHLVKSLPSVLSFWSNYYFEGQVGYFDPSSKLDLLVHTWSLSVEEQFYVAYPFFYIFVVRKRPKSAAAMLAALCAALFSMSVCSWWSSPSESFFFFGARAWEFAAGGLLSELSIIDSGARIDDRRAKCWHAIGLLCIFASALSFDDDYQPPWNLCLPVAGTMLCIYFRGRSASFIDKLLASSHVQKVGLASYSIYLIHQPVFASLRSMNNFNRGQALAAVVSVLALGLLCARYIEEPLREIKRISLAKFLSAMAASVIVLLGCASLENSRLAEVMKTLDGHEYEMPRKDNGWCFYSVDSIKSLTVGEAGFGCKIGVRGRVKALLIGDSYAGHFEPFWGKLAADLDLDIDVLDTNWCYPSFGDGFTGPGRSRARVQCQMNRKHARDVMEKYNMIIAAGRWEDVQKQGLMEEVERFLNDAASNGRLLVLMGQPKQYDRNVVSAYRESIVAGHVLNYSTLGSSRDDAAQKTDTLIAALALSHQAVFLSRSDLFEYEGQVDAGPDGVPYGFDGYHLSIHGSEQSAKVYVGKSSYMNLKSKVLTLANQH